MTDRNALTAGVRTDGEARFLALYEHHYPAIRSFCRRRLASDLVDDAVAETFLTAWRRIDDVPAGDAALLWLYRVAYRVIGHEWRGTARRRRLELRLRSVGPSVEVPIDASVVADDEHRLVLAAAARLAPTDTEALRLAAWERLSVADIAALLGITPNAAKQRLHRARANLAREYRRLEASPATTPDTPLGGSR